MRYLGAVKDNILKTRYLYHGENEDGMWRRVAKHVANGDEDLEHDFYNILSDGLFIPNTPTLMNSGNELGQLSACFVLPIEDSIDSIYTTLHNTAKIFKSGGGVGFNFSAIRPSGSNVGSTNGVASGVLSFMSLFDNTCNVIKQGGKRRGAMMGMLDVEHPEIEQFIDSKIVEGSLSNFNISINVDDTFMEHCEQNELWKKIVHNAWLNGEPGLFFRDAVNTDNPFDEKINCTNPCVTGDTLILTQNGYKRMDTIDVYDEITTWNGKNKPIHHIEIYPNCAVFECEFVLFDGEHKTIKCTLAHQFWKGDDGGLYDTIKLEELHYGDTIQYYDGYGRTNAVFLKKKFVGYETVYDIYEESTDTWITNGFISRGCGEQPLLPYESCNLGHINLSKFVLENGTFNWSLYKLIIHKAIKFLDNVIDVNKYPINEIELMNKNTRKIGLGVMGFAHALILMNIKYGSDEALQFAEQLASTLHFESVEASIQLGEELGYYGWWHEGIPKRRNATVNTIAPTGATSLISETSSSIEPIFSFVYKKTVWNDIDESGSIYIVEPVLEEIIKKEGLNRDEVIEYMERTGKPHHSIPKKYRDVMITANDISWRDHIEMQSVWQKYIDSSISKTINLPNDATEQDVSDAFITAWLSGCKSITVYRNGSRKIEGLSKEIKDKIESGNRPKILRGITFKGRGGCGNIYATINGNGTPYECFVRTSGGCEANNEAIGRLISLCLRNNVKIDDIIKQLNTIKCPTAIASKKSEGKSCAGIVGRFLKQYVDDGVTEEVINLCPECGERLNFGEGCAKGVCKNCGWSGCS